MIYNWVKFVEGLFLSVVYRMAIHGRDGVPTQKPVIFSPNHVNALLDAVSVGVSSKQKVRFFARSDVFRSPLKKWFLNRLSVSPLYRIQEGYSEIKKNEKAFEECKNLINENKTLLIFPEGNCFQEKRLRKLKRGLAKIAFYAEDAFDFKKELSIVPIGLNYFNPNKFNSKIFINYGKPIYLREFEASYKADKAKAINELNRVIEKEMSALLIDIKQKHNDYLFEQLTELTIKEEESVAVSFTKSVKIANKINELEQEQPALLDSIKKKVDSFYSLLKKENYTDLKPMLVDFSTKGIIPSTLLLLMGLPIFTLGVITNYLPFFIARKIANKRVKEIEFYASVLNTISMLLWIVFFLIQIILCGIITSSSIATIGYATIVIVTATCILPYYSLYEKWLLKIKIGKDPKIAHIKKEYTTLVNYLRPIF